MAFSSFDVLIKKKLVCHGSQKNKIKFIISRETTTFCLGIIDISCMLMDPDFVKFVFVNYENGKDFKNMNLNIERGIRTDFVSVCWILYFENFE